MCGPVIRRRPDEWQTEGQIYTAIESDHLELSQEIFLDEENIGTIFLRTDMREMYSRLKQYALIVSFVFLTSILFASVLSGRLQRLISRPILELEETGEVRPQDAYMKATDKARFEPQLPEE